MADIQKGDIVVFKATPNSGEMIVQEVLNKAPRFTGVSIDNPLLSVQFWDGKKQRYEYDNFYFKDVVFVRRD